MGIERLIEAGAEYDQFTGVRILSNQWLDLVRQSGASQYADQLTLEKISISALKRHVSVLFRCEEMLPWERDAPD